jgi:hypothetical protein
LASILYGFLSALSWGAGDFTGGIVSRRAAAKGYRWADMSLTGEDNTDTWPLAHRMGAKIYKRYRFLRKAAKAIDLLQK